MQFRTYSSPHTDQPNSVTAVMLQVILALIPGALAMIWYFGWGILINMLLATATALACESLALHLRGRPIRPTLRDLSAVVTALLFALAVPPLLPWWLTVMGVGFAILVVKQLFGGIGYNPFNPAMAGYVLLLISYPREMTSWLPPEMLNMTPLGFTDTLGTIFTGSLPAGLGWDAVTMATPLDAMRTGLDMGQMISEIRESVLWGDFGGRGWEWIAGWYLLGGAWLLYRRIISWHVPVAVIATALLFSSITWLADPATFPSPAVDLLSGALVLGAFFIATDPVSCCTSDRGRLVFGAGVAILTLVIRRWGGYPDGVAFAVLLMNMAAPLIDRYTRPRIYGHD